MFWLKLFNCSIILVEMKICRHVPLNPFMAIFVKGLFERCTHKLLKFIMSVTTFISSHFPMGYMPLNSHLFLILPTGIYNYDMMPGLKPTSKFIEAKDEKCDHYVEKRIFLFTHKKSCEFCFICVVLLIFLHLICFDFQITMVRNPIALKMHLFTAYGLWQMIQEKW